MNDPIPGLLAAIVADPSDDTVRLIYADAIEDAGQSKRAEFIRVQCELGKLPEFRVAIQILPGERLISNLGPNAAGHWELVAYPNDTDKPVQLDEQLLTDPHHKKRQKLKRQEKKLLSCGGRTFDWIGDWNNSALPGSPTCWHKGDGVCVLFHNSAEDSRWIITFRRGFISSIACTSKDWLAHADAITAQQPIEQVKITNPITSEESRRLEAWNEIAFDITIADQD